MKTLHWIFVIVCGVGLSHGDAGPDPKTYGVIQTLHIVDEEDLPANQDYHGYNFTVNAKALPNEIAPVSTKELPDEIEVSSQKVSFIKERISTNEIAAQGEVDTVTGKKCVKKVMMREETRYEEVMTCNHSYDERCHTSFVTSFQPHQEEDCEENFRKVNGNCIQKIFVASYVSRFAPSPTRTKLSMRLLKNASLRTLRIAARRVLTSAGRVVHTYLTQLNLSNLRTVYDTVCETAQEVHEVVDDVVNCRTENVEMCKDVTNGFITEKKCEIGRAHV